MPRPYRATSSLRVLTCSRRDLRGELATTIVGRSGVEVYRAEKLGDARLIASSLGVQVILVDEDFPNAMDFIGALRREPLTRERSIGVLTRGSGPLDYEWVGAGANAVFRFPADAGWDDRFAKLVSVPARQHARVPVRLTVRARSGVECEALNLSPGGMLLRSPEALRLGEEIAFDMNLSETNVVKGRGQVAREAAPGEYGIEFVHMGPTEREKVIEFLRAVRLEQEHAE